MTLTEEYPWTTFIIACAIVSIGALFIYLKTHEVILWGEFLLWLPVSWLLVLLLAILFHIFLNLWKN